MAIQFMLKKIYFAVNKFPFKIKLNKIKGDTSDEFGNKITQKDQFYRGQIVERDNQIEELRMRLEVFLFFLLKFI